MTTEAELVFMSLTLEELDEATRFLHWMRGQWEKVAELTDRQRMQVGYETDGPWHLLQAMSLAIVREQVGRGGGQEWFAGEPVDKHPEAAAIRYYQDRVALSPGVLDKPRMADTGLLVRQCGLCGRTLPLSATWFQRGGSTGAWAMHCRPCSDASWAADVKARDRVLEGIT